ncbi:L-glyceraldehyde 3-phosphate reductase [Propionibacterium cyclohexanicum]|uniref:L-glyceraldehyde 3-phosphate reductase n=1 Tax=Propionibacterium cyclohexanicum TaxID=64702 RepID=A0A1H9RQC9_9ACTN|nr:L-glyceraldehyde 3-phosphate reductase [Propionibacterium cyclohexanicum]SER74748.1 L-glyceraldehyde 3-phosphate reductase [Propionibacterium cyclohexanicum]
MSQLSSDHAPWTPHPARYDGTMAYRRIGRWGLRLPVISLGLWQNFGDSQPFEVQRAIVRAAFDAGVTHFDLANNYGPPYGQAEINFGTLLRTDLAPWRDELVISTKAGYDMWPGPYGQGGSRKYLLSSLDRSLQRMGIDHVDIFYSHRFDPDTPLDETMSALDQAVRCGKAIYAGISNYTAEQTRKAASISRELGTPLVIHQPRYSMFNRWVEKDPDSSEPGLLDVLVEQGMGAIAFSPLHQGLLTARYLHGVPKGSRASRGGSFASSWLDDGTLTRLRALNELAAARNQTLAQLALAWILRQPALTSVVIGASSVAQLTSNLAAVRNLDFSFEELAHIDALIAPAGHDLWQRTT